MNLPINLSINLSMKLVDLEYTKKDGVAIATLNRPESLNAFRQQTFLDLNAVLEDVRSDEGVRVLVLTGNGRAFSSGADLKEMGSSILTSSLEDQRKNLETYQNLTRTMLALPKTIISAVNGLAVGVGVEIALASDIRIASSDASFTFAEAKRGLFQTNGVMFLLPRLIGAGRAAHIMLTGERVLADRALEYGMVTEVVEPSKLENAARAIAQTIAANAPISVRLVKQVLQQSLEGTLEQSLDLETAGMLECLASQDLIEGTQSFIEKRAPVYQGR
jgi:enoyl-CoA hydratase/carnithine racemase